MFRVRAVSVVGVGYVGLVLAGCLAGRGITCYVTDKDEKRLEQVRAGKAPFYEPDIRRGRRGWRGGG